jgi:hypothetical protein
MTTVKVLLAANFRDERNILEWIQYHRDYRGFHHILLFDDRSCRFPLQLPEHETHDITLKYLHLCKVEYMTRAYDFGIQNGYTHLLYLDLDEYLYLPSSTSTIAEYMTLTGMRTPQENDTNTTTKYDAIAFPWLMFGSNFLNDLPSLNELLPHYTQCSPCYDSHIKMIVPLHAVEIPLTPHHWKWKPRRCSKISIKLLDDGVDTNRPHYDHLRETEWKDTDAFIGHFVNQCWEEFCRRRSRPRDDTRQRRLYDWVLLADRTPPDEFHQQFNERECRLFLR